MLDTYWLPERQRLLRHTRLLLNAGVRLFQYRDKSLTQPERKAMAFCLQRMISAYRGHLIINDDPYLALECGASGVHLGREDAKWSSARALLGHGYWIGVSCYNDLERVAAAEDAGCDYVSLGRFFASQTKPKAINAKLDVLAHARLMTSLPLIAIGGITEHNASCLLCAGADALAVAGALLQVHDPAPVCNQLHELFRQNDAKDC